MPYIHAAESTEGRAGGAAEGSSGWARVGLGGADASGNSWKCN